MDGNDNTDMLNKHCSHSNQDNPSWWRVDLALGHAAVYEIHIVNSFTGDPGKNNLDYKITFGEYTVRNVVFLKCNPEKYYMEEAVFLVQEHTFCKLSLKGGHNLFIIQKVVFQGQIV